MRVLRGLDARVVLAMHRHPFARLHAGREPEPEAEEMAHHRMHVERAMRLAAVQVDRDRGDGDLDQDEARQHVAPPGKIQETAEHEGCALLEGSATGSAKPCR